MWKSMKLGDVCSITNGSTPLRTEERYWKNGTIPWFTIDDLRAQGRNITQTQQLVTQAAVDEKKVRLVPTGSVLLCCTASIGEVAIARIEMATNQQFNALTPKSDTLCSDYLYYVASTLKQTLLSVSGSTTISFIAIGKLKEISIPIPPLAEQQRIVAKLDAAFAEIDKATEIANSKEAEIRQLRTSLLSVMLNANEHVTVKLGDIAKAVGGNGFPTKFQGAMSKAIPFFKVSDMNTDGNEIYMLASNNYVDLCDLKQMKAKAHPKGTIIFPKIGGAISTNKKRVLASTAAFDNNVMGVIPSDKILSEYLYKIFLSLDLYELSNKAALPSITNTTVENIEIPLPPKRIQESIVARLDKAHDAVEVVINAVLKSKENLAALKSAILAQALQPI